MGYTVIGSEPENRGGPVPTRGYTVVDTPPAAKQRGLSGTIDNYPGWMLALSAMTGIHPDMMNVETLKDLARQGGLTARYAIEALSSIGDPINAAIGLKPAEGVAGRMLSSVGVPEPQGDQEKMIGNVSKDAIRTAASLGVGGVLRNSVAPVTKAVGNVMNSAAGSQLAGSTASSVAGSVADQADLPPSQKLFLQLASGVGVPTIGTTALELTKLGARGLKAAVQPLLPSWQRGVVGSAGNRFAEDPASAIANMQNAPEYIPGSQPMIGGASRDPGLIALERGLRAGPGGPGFAADDAVANAARRAAFVDKSGTPQDLAAALDNRENQATQDYGVARDAVTTVMPKDVRKLRTLMNAPAFKTAWSSAEEIAANKLMKPQDMSLENPAFLDLLKKSLDAQIGYNPLATAKEKAAQQSVIELKNNFLDILDNINPQYAIARGNFAENSAPVNRMQTLQKLDERSQAAVPSVTGEPQFSQAKFKGQTTGDNFENLLDPKSGLLPEDYDMLRSLGLDLDRSSLVNTVGKAVGSNTRQELGTAHIVADALGNMSPSNPVARLLLSPVRKVHEWAGVQGDLSDLLDEAARNPQLMAELMAKAPTFQARTTLAKILADRMPGFALGAGETTAAGTVPQQPDQ